MAKKSVIVVIMSVLLLSAIGVAQCPPTKKQRAVNGGVGAGIGALIGGLVGGGKGAAIGAAAGGSFGAASARNRNCIEAINRERNRNPYNDQVAAAGAASPASVDGPTVLLRNVYNRTLEGVIGQALANRGYSLIDSSFYQQNYRQRPRVDWLLDITEQRLNTSSSSGGGGVFTRNFSANGNGAVSGGDYEISVRMVSANTGRVDPSRSAIMTVHSALYRSGNGYAAVSHVYGYGNHTYATNDPAFAAAAEAVNHIFGLK